eukprot:m.380360 g.380360  ORF g.380360 m.380360 type:complete len:466 (+) comp16711_c0_seq42:1226-2623(+)
MRGLSHLEMGADVHDSSLLLVRCRYQPATAATALRTAGVEIWVLGVVTQNSLQGFQARAEYLSMVGPLNGNRLYDLESYEDLPQFASRLENTICKECAEWITPIYNTRLSLDLGRRVCFRITCASSAGNFLLVLMTTSGEAHIFVGTSPHPTPLSSRWSSTSSSARKEIFIPASQIGRSPIYITLYGAHANTRSTLSAQFTPLPTESYTVNVTTDTTNPISPALLHGPLSTDQVVRLQSVSGVDRAVAATFSVNASTGALSTTLPRPLPTIVATFVFQLQVLNAPCRTSKATLNLTIDPSSPTVVPTVFLAPTAAPTTTTSCLSTNQFHCNGTTPSYSSLFCTESCFGGGTLSPRCSFQGSSVGVAVCSCHCNIAPTQVPTRSPTNYPTGIPTREPTQITSPQNAWPDQSSDGASVTFSTPSPGVIEPDGFSAVIQSPTHSPPNGPASFPTPVPQLSRPWRQPLV